MSKTKAVFLGNGFTRSLVGNVPAWGQLIGGANLEDDLQQIIPYTFQYEMNYLGERKSDEETLKSEICRKLPDFSKVELKGAAKSFLSFLAENEITDILTTNYDGLVEHLLLSQNAKLISQNNSEKIYSIRRNYVYKYNEKLITLWKVHGDAVAPKSVMLGLDHYCGAIGKMDDFIKHGRLGGKTTDNPMEMKFPNKAKSDITKNKIETFQFQTWVDLFFVATVYFIGFGLDFSETDIWWLLNKRARFKEKLEISNEIFFYAPQQQKTETEAEVAKAKAEAEAKEKVLESFGVQYQIVSYEFRKHSANPEYLLDVYEMISRQSGC